MKKLILFIVLSLVMCGCTSQVNEDYGVVTNIETSSRYTNYSYVITIKGFGLIGNGNVKLYTNDITYHIGDTIKITRQNAY